MIDRRLRNLWNSLLVRKPDMPHFLTGVGLTGIRGCDGLRVRFHYPVSVIVGENGSGKSTVLSAAASAYKVPGAGAKEFVPSTLFPDYQPKSGRHGDPRGEAIIELVYSTPRGSLYMRWRRTKGWNRSFGGRRNATQPERPVYLRASGNLANPSELRGVPGMSRMKSVPQESSLTGYQIDFAQRLLPFDYSAIVNLSEDSKANLLVATQKNGAAYSELHMGAGERAVLRLSKEIAQAKGALVLIDEVEAGLHPVAQKFLMLELQKLALRNDLQIIVTTHSPVVLDSVHETGRVFLERDEAGGVSVHRPYRDLIQDALYGRLYEKLNLLCESRMAESLLQGVFDIITSRLNARMESIRIGSDTGADEFPVHAKAFERFDLLQNFIFVLDGDKRETDLEQKIQKNTKRQARVMFLPGADAPEVWVWHRMRDFPDNFATGLGVDSADLARQMDRLNTIYDVAVDSASNIAKVKFRNLSEVVDRPDTEICRVVARREAGRKESDIQPLVEYLETAFQKWRRGT